MIQQWPSLLQDIEDQIFDGHFSERRRFVQVANDFSSQNPEVVKVPANGGCTTKKLELDGSWEAGLLSVSVYY